MKSHSQSSDGSSAEFNETFLSDRVDPLAESCAEFDWDDLYHRLGETEDWQDDDLNLKLAQLVRHIFEWVTDTNWNTPGIDKTIGRRFIALVWVTNPELFAGSPSLRELASRLGFSPAILANITGEVSRTFGLQNRAQAHAWNRKEAK